MCVNISGKTKKYIMDVNKMEGIMVGIADMDE